MARFSGQNQTPRVQRGPIRSTGASVTFEGGQGTSRDAKSDLFLLAISNFHAQNTFYEGAVERDDRFRSLIAQVVKEDEDWVRRFVPFLRDTMQMRTASIVLAAEAVAAGISEPRKLVSDAMSRADEPAEMLGYWLATYGRKIPMAVKRGIADGAVKLYNQRSALRYDGQSRGIRMGDVIELVHPKPQSHEQSLLFKFLLEKTHNRDIVTVDPLLKVIAADRVLMAFPESERRAALGGDLFDATGWSWERLSGWLPGGMDREAWEAVIPTMGYMALLRNLRNFDNAGVSSEVKAQVAAKLADEAEVAKSRQFPIRFFSAWNNLDSLVWGPALEQAVEFSTKNLPELPGRSLVLVDTSGSMVAPVSKDSKVMQWQIAALFGLALAKRNAARTDLFAYSNSYTPFTVTGSTSILRTVEKFMDWHGSGGGTETIRTLLETFNGHDRIVVLTDEQGFYSDRYTEVNNINVPIFTFNVVGYGRGHLPSGEHNRYSFGGGLTDATFTLLKVLDDRRDGSWPF